MKSNLLSSLRSYSVLAFAVVLLGFAKPAVAQDGIYLPNDLYWMGKGVLTENSSDVNIAVSDDIYYLGMSILNNELYNVGSIEDADLKNVGFAIFQKNNPDYEPDGEDEYDYDPTKDYVSIIENADWRNFALGYVNNDEGPINDIGNDDIFYLASALVFKDEAKLESIWHYTKSDVYHLGLAILKGMENPDVPYDAPYLDSIQNTDLRAFASAYTNGEKELESIKNPSFYAVAKAIFSNDTEALINSEDIDWNRAARAIVDKDQDAQYEIFNGTLSTFAQAIMDNDYEKLYEIVVPSSDYGDDGYDDSSSSTKTDDGYNGNDLYFLGRGLMTLDVSYVDDIDNSDLKLLLEGVITKNKKLFKEIQEYDLKYVGMCILKKKASYAKKISSPDWRLFVGHVYGKLSYDILPEDNEDRYFRSDDIFYLTRALAGGLEDALNNISYN